MIIVANYKEYYNDAKGYYTIRVYQQLNCPMCFSDQLKVIGRHRRYARLGTGERIRYSLKRYQCSGCGKTHVELPDSIIPFKHYTADAIYMSLTNPELYPCERSTYERWRQNRCLGQTLGINNLS